MAVALVTIPPIARIAGAERLGFLGLTWALIGYFGLFDLGLSRVITRRIALAEHSNSLASERRVVIAIVWRITAVVAAVSLVMAFAVPARWIVGIHASPEILHEAIWALPILWFTLPATVVTGLMRGVLEGRQRFGMVNLLRASLGVWSFCAPLVMLFWTHSLVGLVAVIAVGRFAALGVHTSLALGALPGPTEKDVRPAILPLVREGGWLTVSNVVGPLMVTADRFVIAGMLSLAASAQYFVPQEITLRLLVIPAALAITVFPILAKAKLRVIDEAQVSRVAFLAAACVTLPFGVALSGLSEIGLRSWMGSAYAPESALVAQVLALGLFANASAQVPFAWIQAAGRADLTGKLHLIEAPFYLAALVWAVPVYGIYGAAWCWSLRALLDFGALVAITGRLFPHAPLRQGVRAVVLGLAAIACVTGGMEVEGSTLRVGLLVVGILSAAGLFVAWFAQLLPSLHSVPDR